MSTAGREALTSGVAPRAGIEPASLILIQSQAGPASRPTGDRAGQPIGRPGDPPKQREPGHERRDTPGRRAAPAGNLRFRRLRFRR